MTEDEYAEEVAAVAAAYPESRVVLAEGTLRALRVAPVPIPRDFWGGGVTRALVIFDLANHETTRPPGFLGDEWRLPSGAAPKNATPAFQHGEAWQAFSWSFSWPPALGVLQTVEAYLGRFSDHC